jgi:4-hydroxy-3-methylbut-2-enyl diphosphate reductase
VTGGASCPDGIIQQVIVRLNALFPADQLRRVEAVLADLSASTSQVDGRPGMHSGQH